MKVTTITHLGKGIGTTDEQFDVMINDRFNFIVEAEVLDNNESDFEINIVNVIGDNHFSPKQKHELLFWNAINDFTLNNDQTFRNQYL